MSWSETLQQLLLGIAPMLIAFVLTYYVKEKAKREAIINKAYVVASTAEKAIAAVEDIFANSPNKPTGVEKLKKAVEIANQMLEKVGIYLSKDEIETEIRAAFQDSPYNKGKES